MDKKFIKSVGLGLLATSVVMLPMAAFATSTSLSTLATTATTQITSAKNLLMNVSVLAGVGFILGGIVKFKAHKDNPTQVALSVPITLLLIGGALVGLKSVVSMSAGTLGVTEGSVGADPSAS